MPRNTVSGDSESARPAAALAAEEAAALAVERLVQLTSKDVQGVTSVEPMEDGWLVEVEALEDRRIPSSADILALYEVEIDFDGHLLAYRRSKRYSRGSTDIGSRERR